MRLAAAAVALVMALSACSSEEAGPKTLPPLPSGEATKVPSTPSAGPRPSAAATASTSSSEAPSSTSEPAQATSQDARAFALQFFEDVNAAYVARDAARIRRLSEGQCGSCAAVSADIERLAASRHSVVGRRYILSSAEAAPPDHEGQFVVDFRFTSDPYVERDDGGRVARQFPAQAAQDGQIMLVRTGASWRVRAIRLIDG